MWWWRESRRGVVVEVGEGRGVGGGGGGSKEVGVAAGIVLGV